MRLGLAELYEEDEEVDNVGVEEVMVGDIDEELVVIDGATPTTSTSSDSSAFAGVVITVPEDVVLEELRNDLDVEVSGEDVGAEASAMAGETVPEAITVVTTVVVTVVVTTAAWFMCTLGVAEAEAIVPLTPVLGDEAGTSRAPATYTSVTF